MPQLPVSSSSLISRRDLLGLRFREEESGFWIRVHRRAMACRFEIALSGEDRSHVEAARDALDDVDGVEAALTIFRETSEVARVNRRAAQEPVAVDDCLFEMLRLCRQLHAQTDGAFDITTTPLSRCWGFLRRQGRLPSPQEIEWARRFVGMDQVELDESARTVRFRRPGIELNLGGVGKGYALRRVAGLLRERGVGHALLSAGGSSVLALGGRGRGWLIDTRSRQVTRERLARIRLRDGALGTSGAGEQFVDVAGKRYGHVLDPRTGWPASGVLSATVIAADGAVADALSTAFLVGGMGLAKRYCASHAGTLALITPDDGSERPRAFGGYPGAILSEES